MTGLFHRSRPFVASWRVGLAAALTLLAGCGDTGQSRTTFPISAAGTAPETITVGPWEVTVREARVALGPVYLCSAQNAGLESCTHAAAEHLEATSFDALSAEPTPMGSMTGTTGVTVLSGMWEYGRTWRLSELAPRALSGAVDGEHSVVLEITASRATEPVERRYRFVLDVDGRSQPTGSTAARGRLAPHVIHRAEAGLVVRFDPTLWASMLDFEALAALPAPESGDAVEVPSAHPSHDALVAALTATGLPSFEWQPQ